MPPRRSGRASPGRPASRPCARRCEPAFRDRAAPRAVASSSASRNWCVDMMMVRPCAERLRSRSCSSAMARSSSAVNGSSRISSEGACRKARATARRCRMPREYSRTGASFTLSRPVRSSHSSAALAGSASAVQAARTASGSRTPRAPRRPRCRGRGCRPCGESSVSRPVLAEHPHAPRVAGDRPARMRSSVVLPAPLRPSRAMHCPGSTSSADVAQGGIVAVELPDVLERRERSFMLWQRFLAHSLAAFRGVSAPVAAATKPSSRMPNAKPQMRIRLL